MSFILDALRKSETERQRQATPGLADAQYHIANQPRSNWLPVLSIVLAVTVVIFAVMFFNGMSDTGSVGMPAIPAASPGVEAVPRPLIQATGGSVETRPAVAPVRLATAEINVAEPGVATNKAYPAIDATPRPVQALAEPEPFGLPSMPQLIQSGQLSVAPLHMDIHVYAGESAKRFVFINMSKYREGERLAEGPLLEQITSSGAILSHQGNRFTLDRE